MTFDTIGENEAGMTDGEGHRVATPVALMTAGWDAAGSPLHMREYRNCSTAILELPQVVKWFVSHERRNNTRPPKVSSECFSFSVAGLWSAENGRNE